MHTLQPGLCCLPTWAPGVASAAFRRQAVSPPPAPSSVGCMAGLCPRALSRCVGLLGASFHPHAQDRLANRPERSGGSAPLTALSIPEARRECAGRLPCTWVAGRIPASYLCSPLTAWIPPPRLSLAGAVSLSSVSETKQTCRTEVGRS